ncbi:hypothetical protein [Nonomuraea mesophila]|nr:hypothetical protein [Nonomuraea mesophila]
MALRRHDALTTLGADWLLGIAATTLDTDAHPHPLERQGACL